VQRILLISGHDSFCNSLRRFLEDQSDIAICCCSCNGVKAVQAATNSSPDLILLKTDIQPMSFEIADALKSAMPRVPVFLITDAQLTQAEKEAWSHGISAVFQKDEEFNSLLMNVRAVCSG